MNIKTKIVDIYERYEEPLKAYMLSLRDVRNVGSLAFVVLVLLISWSGVKAIETNYRLQQQISKIEQQNAVTQLQNENQKLTNAYYTTPQYYEVTARQNFGLAAPGETVLLVPKDVALSHTVPLPADKTQVKPAKNRPFWQKNMQSWMDFFLHRQTTD